MALTGEACEVAILALEEHQNYFVNLCEILSTHEGRVVLFASEGYRSNVVDRIDETAFEWQLRSAEESVKGYLSRVESICGGGIDILILFPFPGMRSILSSLRFDPDCRMVQMVYNVNLWTMQGIMATPRLYKYLEPPLRKFILSRMDAALVEYTSIEECLASRVDIDVYSFTPIVHECTTYHSSKGWQVTIPGFIDPDRRDYDIVLNALETSLASHRDNIRIRLLGRPLEPEGQRIATRFDELADLGWDITYPSDWVPIEEFEEQLAQTDAVLSPMRKTIDVSPVTERYGVTKATGCFGDAIRYGKPLVLPDHYRVPEEVAPVVRQYGGPQDFSDVLLNTLQHGGLSQEEILKLRRQYRPETQRRQLYNIFESVLIDLA